MAAVQTNNIDYHPEEVDLEFVIKSLINEFEFDAKNQGLKLSFTKETEKVKILSDEYIISEIFQNLINNAIKYTKTGGVEIKLFNNGKNKLSVSVKDTGIGISKEYLPKLFQAFTQEETGYSRSFEGNGLGLALVKNYVDLIEAEINVDTEKDKGSEFTVTFDLAKNYHRK
ncbi:MAG: ATP-binding protein [Ignavibacteriaceae bacterium]